MYTTRVWRASEVKRLCERFLHFRPHGKLEELCKPRPSLQDVLGCSWPRMRFRTFNQTQICCSAFSHQQTNADTKNKGSMADENYASDLNVGRPQLHHLQEIPNKDMLSVTWNNGEQDSFPHIFLRDNCRCPFCYDTVAKQRIFDTVKAADLDIRPKSFWLDDIDSSMHIIWPDGHESMFSSEWLYERRFPKMPADIKPNNFMKPIHWGSELNNDVPSVYFDEVLSDDEVLYSWLETLATYGFCLLKDAPKRSGAIHELSKRFPHIRKTHYGETWTVSNRPDPSNIAYTVCYLPLHTDLPFYHYQPGVQILHCVEQASGDGGVSHFVDGFNIAAQLKEQNPEAFEILSTVKFRFEDVGKDYYGAYSKELERPVIGLDLFGNVESVSHNNHVRSSFINAPPEMVKKSYEAYYSIYKLMYEPSNLLEYKLQSGEIATFNNKRVLHGRTAYNLTSPRLLEGFYVDWDEVYSVMRVIKDRQEKRA